MTREMKNSGVEWIGKIPVDWKTTKLKNVITFLNGYAFDSRELSNEGEYPVIRIGDIVNGEIDFINTNKTNTCNEVIEKFTIKENDILIAMSGATVGKTGVAHNVPHKSFINQRVGIIRSETNSYVYHYLNNGEFIKYILLLSVGSAQPNISTENIYNYYIPAPTLTEQKRIADFLDSKVTEIDKIISETKASIENYKEYKQSVITEAVTKGLDKNVPMKDSGVEWIGDIPSEWEIIKLKKTFSFGKGLPITKENLIESGIPVISYGQIHSKKNTGTSVNEHLIRYVEDTYVNTNPNSLVSTGDIIFADTSEDLDGCGNCVYVDVDYPLFAGYHTIILRSSQDDNKYYSYLFKTDCWRSQIRSRVTGIKLFSVTQKILKEITIIQPPEKEQIRIAEILDRKCAKIDNIIKTKEILITNLEEYKKSLIYEYVTGKKAVE